MPTVSVIVPIYNQEKYLKQCIVSIQNQTFRDIEILCVDDGSTDSSPTILLKLAATDSRIHLLFQSNAGAGAARNHGMDHAAGEYITFLDSDDTFESDMLEKLYKKAKTDDADIVVCRADSFNGETGTREAMPWSLHDEWLPSHMPFSSLDVQKNFFEIFVWWPWDKLYKKSYIDSLGIRFQQLRTTNDLFFVCASVVSAGRISYIQDVLAHHRVGVNTSLSVTREKSWDNFCKALCALQEYLFDEELYQRFRQDFINYCLNFSMWHLETLHDTSYIKLYRTLKHKWFNQWQVYDHEKEYFYQPRNYEKLEFIRNEPDMRCFDFKAVFLEKDLSLRNQELWECRETNNDLQENIKQLQQQVDQLELDKKQLQNSLNQLKSAQNALLHSVSFRAGRMLTFLPRVMRNLIKSK